MGRGKQKPTTTHHPTPQPPKNLTASVATLKAELNATEAALATEVALKLGGATVNGTLPRFVGDVTCYVVEATGDVVGLQVGSTTPLFSTAGKPRTFAVPADGYISDVKVAVDKATGLVGELAFIVKSNASMVLTNIVTCGTHGGVGVSVMPKLSALSSVGAACVGSSSSGLNRRLHQYANGLAINPATLNVVATTIGAPPGAPSGAPPGPPPLPPTVNRLTATTTPGVTTRIPNIPSPSNTVVTTGFSYSPGSGPYAFTQFPFHVVVSGSYTFTTTTAGTVQTTYLLTGLFSPIAAGTPTTPIGNFFAGYFAPQTPGVATFPNLPLVAGQQYTILVPVGSGVTPHVTTVDVTGPGGIGVVTP